MQNIRNLAYKNNGVIVYTITPFVISFLGTNIHIKREKYLSILTINEKYEIAEYLK